MKIKIFAFAFLLLLFFIMNLKKDANSLKLYNSTTLSFPMNIDQLFNIIDGEEVVDRDVYIDSDISLYKYSYSLPKIHDHDGGQLTISKISNVEWGNNINPKVGSISVNNDGKSVIYIHEPEFLGDISFDYTVTDGWGGESVGRFTIQLVDMEPPVITLNDGNGCSTADHRKPDLFCIVGDTFTEPEGTVADNCDGDLSWMDVTSSVSFFDDSGNETHVSAEEMLEAEGIYSILYSIYDSSGNIGYTSRQAYVFDEREDYDGDEILNEMEIHGMPMPLALIDFYKRIGEIPEHETPSDHLIKTNPRFTDSDKDDLSDYEEMFTTFTNPLVKDTDYDGISDGDEVLKYNTDPLNADSDDDGVSDGEELDDRTDPNDEDSSAIQGEISSEDYYFDEE